MVCTSAAARSAICCWYERIDLWCSSVHQLEITAVSVAISRKNISLILNQLLTVLAIFPFAPTAVVIGFVGAFLGGLSGMAMMVLFKSPVIMIPAAGICFFSGGNLRCIR